MAETAEPGPEIPEGLWDRVRADPVRAPEHIALAASAQHAPAAAAWAQEKRSRLAHDGHQLAQMAKRRHAALAWIQTRLVFFVAAAYGYDPHDPMRPAELLVLMGLYDDVPTARSALDGVGRTIAEAYVGSRMQRDEALAMRLARMVGKRAARRFAGRLIPGVAIAFNAIGNERDTRALADRAIRFYGG